MNLKNKVIIVTGATRGIGKALVDRLSQEKSHVIAITRSKENIKDKRDGKQYVCDLSDKNQIFSLVDQIKKYYKSIDVLVNVAGIGIYKPLEEATYDEWDKSLAINVTAPFILTKGLLPLFNNSNSLIMNIGSGAGTMASKKRFVYSTTKFALRGLTLNLAEEFKGRHPSFCLITLGSTLTRFGIGDAYTLEQKLKLHKEGHAYFTPEWVADKLVEIIKDDNRKSEIVLYPGDYGFGTWKKP